MPPKTLEYNNGTTPSSHATRILKLRARSQSQKVVPNGAIIAVTVILGVLFIAFVLTVIYWRYMAKLDKEDRDKHARTELERRAKNVESPSSGSAKTHRTAYQPRPRDGNGPSRGKHRKKDAKRSLAYSLYTTGSSNGYRKAWAPYRSPRATANRFEEVDMEDDQDYPRQSGHQDFAHQDYRGYPPHFIRHFRHASFCSSKSSSYCVDGPRASRAPRRGQSLSDNRSSRPAHIHFEADRRPATHPQAYTAQGRPQSSTFPPFNHMRSFCPLQDGIGKSFRSLSANSVAIETNPSWDPRSRGSSIDPGNFDEYRPPSSIGAQLGPRTDQRHGRNNSFPSVDLHSRSRRSSPYGPVSGKSSQRGPVSDTAHSDIIEDLESDPEGSYGRRRFDRHSPYEHSRSPRGFPVSVDSLSQGNMQHESHGRPPDFHSYDKHAPGAGMFEGPNGHQIDPRAETEGGGRYGREGDRPDRLNEGREDIH